MNRHTLMRLALQLSITAVLAGVLAWSGVLSGAGAARAAADARLLVLAGALVIASNTLHGLRWWLLVRRAGRVPLGSALLILHAATGLSLLLPLRAGAALQVQVLCRRYGVSRLAVAGTLVAEALLDAAALVLLALVLAPFLPLGLSIGSVALVGVAAAGFALVTLLLLRRKRQAGRPLGGRVAALGQSLAALGSARMAAALLAVWVVALALGLPLAPPAVMAIEIAGNLAGAVPLTHANAGTYELAVSGTAAGLGAGADLAGALAGAAHTAGILATLLVGVGAAWVLRLGRADLFCTPPAGSDQARNLRHRPAAVTGIARQSSGGSYGSVKVRV